MGGFQSFTHDVAYDFRIQQTVTPLVGTDAANEKLVLLNIDRKLFREMLHSKGITQNKRQPLCFLHGFSKIFCAVHIDIGNHIFKAAPEYFLKAGMVRRGVVLSDTTAGGNGLFLGAVADGSQ